jgi:hydroxymethylglutaryl-CoA reductase (NADPH)
VPVGHQRALRQAELLKKTAGLDQLAAGLAPRTGDLPSRVRLSSKTDGSGLEERWRLARLSKPDREALEGARPAEYEGHIENFLGEARTPVGLAGPIRVNGASARADYYVPLATHEAALVASYSRGMQIASEAGGVSAWVLNQGVTRAPGFAFRTTSQAGLFVAWALENLERFKEVAASTTSHGRLTDMRITVEGNHVYLNFEYYTADAAGQNMVTLATEAVCRHIETSSPHKPRYWFVEANMSGDKKASAQSYLTVRGRKVTAETILAAGLVQRRLSTTPQRMSEYWRMSTLGGVMSGTMGVHGHISNGLAALYLACGQDIACVAESSVGVTRMEVTEEGDLYAAVTLPNLIVGTVGGGTGLPTPRACLNILGLRGEGKAGAFAELCGAVVLAGELSIVGALCAGHFARAHERLARGRKKGDKPGA